MGATVDLASVSGLVHLWAVLSHPVELISGYLCVMVIQMCYVLMTQQSHESAGTVGSQCPSKNLVRCFRIEAINCCCPPAERGGQEAWILMENEGDA